MAGADLESRKVHARAQERRVAPIRVRLLTKCVSDSRAWQASAATIRAKHPDRVPVIVDKREGDSLLPDIDKVCAVPGAPCPWEELTARAVCPVFCRKNSSSLPT